MSNFSRQGRWLAFSALFAASLILPWSLRLLFSQPSEVFMERQEIPQEQPAFAKASEKDAAGRAKDLENNVAWLRGEGAIVPYQEITSPESNQPETNQLEPAEGRSVSAGAGLSPGIFAAYMRSWDSLDTTRQRGALGVYIYPFPQTRLEAFVSRHRFKDDSGEINGHGGGIQAAHRIGDRWVLEEGLSVNGYDGLRQSLNGFARAGYTPRENLFISLDARVEDMWERLPNIRDGLRLWSVSPYLYYSFLADYWVSGYWSAGFFSDKNFRQALEGELGRFLMRKIGLSLSAGVETYQFREPRDTYWTPSFYRFLFGRVRFSKNFEYDPWERRAPGNIPRRFGYLAEYTAGLTETHDVDQTLRGGLSLRAFTRWVFRAEAYHLNSHSRFADHYYENRIDGRIDYEF